VSIGEIHEKDRSGGMARDGWLSVDGENAYRE